MRNLNLLAVIRTMAQRLTGKQNWHGFTQGCDLNKLEAECGWMCRRLVQHPKTERYFQPPTCNPFQKRPSTCRLPRCTSLPYVGTVFAGAPCHRYVDGRSKAADRARRPWFLPQDISVYAVAARAARATPVAVFQTRWRHAILMLLHAVAWRPALQMPTSSMRFAFMKVKGCCESMAMKM
ncbi:hypothetical protein [Noviherbaspirillum aerium]|uniref:hypothetical protein n=1 Tax=Noviherbaspirillum aerium TaxID=2588497 RepID=UPI00124E75AF|nr:hypothetical protein [Noviherbaspirillum aerium]